MSRDGDGFAGIRKLNDHRLEGGGFGSRLKARLLWEPEKKTMPRARSMTPVTSGRPLRRRSARRTGSGRLEGEGF